MAETVFGTLMTDYRLTFDRSSGRVKFDCRMTQVGQAGAPNIGFSVPMPPDILSEFMTYKPFKGMIGQHSFLVTGFTVEITVSKDQNPPSSPQPQRAAASEDVAEPTGILSRIDWGAVGFGLVVLGTVAAAVFFFPGTAMAVAVIVVAGGLGALLWDSAEAKDRSGPIIGGGHGGVTQIPQIVVTARRPR